MDFKKLLSPFSKELFFERYFEKESLLILGRDKNYYNEIFTKADLDSWVFNSGIRHPFFSMSKTVRLDPKRFTKSISYGSRVIDGSVDHNLVIKEYNLGASIIIDLINQHSQKVGYLCSFLSNELGFQISGNAYISPPNSQAFGKHSDIEDVFILQLAGSKSWKIYELEDDNKIKDDIVLNEGDLAYIPKGVSHEAVSTDSHSIHLTLGIKNSSSWAMLFRKITYEITETEEFAKKITYDSDSNKSRLDFDRLKKSLIDKISHIEPNLVLDRAEKQSILDKEDYPKSFFENLFSASDITLKDYIGFRKGAKFYIEIGVEDFDIFTSGRKISFPIKCKPAFDFLSSEELVSIADLPNLSIVEKVDFAKDLLEEGLIYLE